MTDYIWANCPSLAVHVTVEMTCVLLLSDIHANLPALEAVLEDAAKRDDLSETWVLGDSIGYGAQPNEVIDLLRSLPSVYIVKGNHEAAALGEISVENFNPTAGAAAIWTQRNLRPDVADYSMSLPLVITQQGVTLCHGTPRNPIWEYMFTPLTADLNLQHFETTGCVLGHTHIPSIFGLNASKEWTVRQATSGEIFDLDFERWYANPGSVGQPRDLDPRASYAILSLGTNEESPTIAFRRVEYNIERAQGLILDARLPNALAFRLSVGR